MTVDPGFVLAAIAAIVGGVVWLVRLEAKITRVDERHGELKKDFWRLRNQIEGGKVYVFRRSPESEGE